MPDFPISRLLTLPLCLAGALAADDPRPLRITADVALERELRYRPDGEEFVIVDGERRFNRALYGVPGPGRVEGGDQPRFSLYLPGKGGTLWVGMRGADGSRWAHEAERVETRYLPGELRYEITDPILAGGTLRLHLLARDDRDGLLLRSELEGGGEPIELVFAYGSANGRRFSRGGDIGGDPVDSFDLKPSECAGLDFTLDASRFALEVGGRRPFRMTGTFPAEAELAVHGAGGLESPQRLLDTAPDERRVLVARLPLRAGAPRVLTIARREEGASEEAAQLNAMFDRAVAGGRELRGRVRLETPDPYLNTLGAAISLAADGVWEPPSFVHGAVAWPQRLNGWRGAYAADPLGTPQRARDHIRYYAGLQLLEPADGPVEPDPAMNLARQTKNEGTRLYSRGYIASSEDKKRNHYDMNLVFIDMLVRHLMWTGDREFAREVWPLIVRHLEWEKRCFDADDDGLYDAFACIWASDALQYTGGGVTHSSAYNHFHNQQAARIAGWIGEDPEPYRAEAAKILAAMNERLWIEDGGHFAEYVDFLGGRHPSAALWTFYHAIDSRVPSSAQAWRMSRWADRHFAHLPVPNPDDAERPYHVLPTTDWHPYVWSVNNVAMAEVTHGALAYWQAGRPEKAFHLWKGTVLDNLYYGASPGNFQQLSFLDAFRGELYRDFADTVGINARAIVEGLLGFEPDAIGGSYLLRPGFPRDWEHASWRAETLGYEFRRSQGVDRYVIEPPLALELHAEVPARTRGVGRVRVNGAEVPARIEAAAGGRPVLRFRAAAAERHEIAIEWSGDAIAGTAPAVSARPAAAELGPLVRDWDFTVAEDAVLEPVPLGEWFNDSVNSIFEAGKYLDPRPDSVTLQLPTQGVGDWPAFGETHEIDDRGLRRVAAAGVLRSPQGIPLATPDEGANVLFTSRWANYPAEARIGLAGRASRVFLLMAGSTNHMQSRIDNGEVVVKYADGSSERLALRNPDTWWPIEENYFADDYAFRIDTPFPPRLHLASGRFEPVGEHLGEEIHGGAATLLGLQLDPARELESLTLRTLTNEVVVGLMAVTLERP